MTLPDHYGIMYTLSINNNGAIMTATLNASIKDSKVSVPDFATQQLSFGSMNTKPIEVLPCNMKEINVSVPEVATKQLKISNNRVVLSSNWLLLFGFKGEETPTIQESLGAGKGVRVRLANEQDILDKISTNKVHTREYKKASSSPLNPVTGRKERLIQITRKDLITEALGEDSTHVHITFTYGELIFRGVKEEEFKLLQNLNDDEKINTLVALTGGIDCNVLENSGFRVDTVIEYRPKEMRDSVDYTELTSLSVLANSKPRVLINEDIYKLNPTRLAELVGSTPITVAHFSLQCDDYSTLKTKKQKSTSVDDISSTLDMFIPMLNLLDVIKPPVLVIENVKGFLSSPINDVVRLQLQRRGYAVHQKVLDARDYEGNTSRQRLYLVATTLKSPFNFPEPVPRSQNVWDDVIVPNWNEIIKKDVTHTKVIQTAITSGRLRVITKEKPFSPTLTKAQGQDTKDSVVVQHEGRYYRLPVKVQMQLNMIDPEFDIDWMPVDKAAQIIGQSICCNLHHAVMDSVKSHILRAAA